MSNPNEMLENLQHEIKSFIGRQNSKLVEIEKRLDSFEVKAARPSGGGGGNAMLLGELKQNSDLGRLIGCKSRGSAKVEFSAAATGDLLSYKTISNPALGFVSSGGVVPSAYEPAIVPAARPALHMRDVIATIPTTAGEVIWARESARPTKASPVTEYSGLKPSSEPSFELDREPVQTIALLTTASRQVLEDWPALEAFLRFELSNRVNEELDLQILSGSGVAPDLNGIITQAQAWDLSLLTASDGYEYCDILAGARQQIAADNELQNGFFYVLHPNDSWKIKRVKDSTGRYIFDGAAGGAGPLYLWGAPVIETSQITSGTFLAGSADPSAVAYYERMPLVVEISTEHSTNFAYNLCTIRAELRGAMVVKRPNAFVTGSLTQSPA